MRIVLVGPVYPYRGGIALYTTTLHEALIKSGHEVRLISFKRLYPQWLFPGKSDKDPSQKYSSVEDAQYLVDTLNPLTWLKAFCSIAGGKPELIILQWWTPFLGAIWFLWGLLNRLFLRKPLVFICHNVLPHEAHWWDQLLARLILRWGQGFTVSSMQEKARITGVLPQAQAIVTPHPVYSIPVNRIPQDVARTKLDIPHTIPVLLFFGIVREYKGLADLLTAMPEVRSRFRDAILLVAGEFWDEKQGYLTLVHQLDLEGVVIFDDRYIPNEEVADYFSAADVLVSPYRRVTGSGVVQLARSFQIPIITTVDTPGVRPEYLVPVEDSHALAEAIITFLEEKQRGVGVTQFGSGEGEFTWMDLVGVLEDFAL